MYCRFCGHELTENENICPNCFKDVNEFDKHKKKKINKKIVIIISLVVLFVLTGLIVIIAIVNDNHEKEMLIRNNELLASIKAESNNNISDDSKETTKPVSEGVDNIIDQMINSDANSDKKGSGTLVKELDFGASGGIKPGKNSVKVQSLYYFAKDEMIYHGIEQQNLNYCQKFGGAKEDAAIIEKYVELLNQDSMNFTLADSYFMEYGSTFASWGFNYTGNANVKNTCDIQFIDNDEQCAVAIYYTIDRNKFEGYIYWSGSLEIEDLGYRYNGITESVAPAGKSACAGLVRTTDGQYKTTDGRFNVNPNEVQMYVNNSLKKCSLEYEKNNESDKLIIKDSAGNSIIKFFFSKSKAPFTGEIYDNFDLALDSQYSIEPTGMNSDVLQIFQLVNDAWLRPTHKDNPFSDLTYRTVYYNESEKIAAFYLYTNVLKETEMFCVVDLNDVIDKTQNSSGGDSDFFVPDSGGYEKPQFAKPDCTFCHKGDCSKCDGYGYVYGISINSDKPQLLCGDCSGTGNCWYCGGTGKRE